MPSLYKAPSHIRGVPKKWGITVNRKLSIMTRVGYKHFEKVIFQASCRRKLLFVEWNLFLRCKKFFVFETLFISAYLRSWASWAEIYLRTKNLVLFFYALQLSFDGKARNFGHARMLASHCQNLCVPVKILTSLYRVVCKRSIGDKDNN